MSEMPFLTYMKSLSWFRGYMLWDPVCQFPRCLIGLLSTQIFLASASTTESFYGKVGFYQNAGETIKHKSRNKAEARPW